MLLASLCGVVARRSVTQLCLSAVEPIHIGIFYSRVQMYRYWTHQRPMDEVCLRLFHFSDVRCISRVFTRALCSWGTARGRRSATPRPRSGPTSSNGATHCPTSNQNPSSCPGGIVRPTSWCAFLRVGCALAEGSLSPCGTLPGRRRDGKKSHCRRLRGCDTHTCVTYRCCWGWSMGCGAVCSDVLPLRKSYLLVPVRVMVCCAALKLA